MMENESSALGFLHALPGIGQRSLWKIKQNFASFIEVFYADYVSLKNAGLADKAIRSIQAHFGNPPDESWLLRLNEQGIYLLTIEDAGYPKLLKNIYDPPYLLYYQGNLQPDAACFGVVGARKPSQYGRTQARKLAGALAGQGMVIVSGLARGIDTEAHRGALEAEGVTIAVLGSGLLNLYPAENKELARKITEKGAIISEYPLLTPPEPGNFPARNRIISGLSQGILVVEAKEKSGALITADFALEQGREVYALPGALTSELSRGTNRLIQQGAKLVLGPEDILEDCRTDWKNSDDLTEFSLEEEKIILLLKDQNLHIDEIFREAGLEYGVLTTLLLQLELKNCLTRLAGSIYTLNTPYRTGY